MRIYTKAGDLAFSTFTFPDGQPHFKLETYEREFQSVVIETAIKSPSDLFLVLMASDVLRQHGYAEVSLDIRYLMGARMDRAISSMEPFSLQLVAKLLNGGGFTKIRILDVHSDVATRLIRNSVNVLPKSIVRQVFTTLGSVNPVRPDKGAEDRVKNLLPRDLELEWGSLIRCEKTRDPETGMLSGFKVKNHSSSGGWDCLIIDDICDGGGTFVGLAKELRKAGARKVYLYVTHGIFSKGLAALEGIDKIFTTDSYCPYAIGREFQRTVIIPISMKELP